MNDAGLALLIFDIPAVDGGPGSAMNSLRSAWTGASVWLKEPIIRAKPAWRGGSPVTEIETGKRHLHKIADTTAPRLMTHLTGPI